MRKNTVKTYISKIQTAANQFVQNESGAIYYTFIASALFAVSIAAIVAFHDTAVQDTITRVVQAIVPAL